MSIKTVNLWFKSTEKETSLVERFPRELDTAPSNSLQQINWMGCVERRWLYRMGGERQVTSIIWITFQNQLYRARGCPCEWSQALHHLNAWYSIPRRGSTTLFFTRSLLKGTLRTNLTCARSGIYLEGGLSSTGCLIHASKNFTPTADGMWQMNDDERLPCIHNWGVHWNNSSLQAQYIAQLDGISLLGTLHVSMHYQNHVERTVCPWEVSFCFPHFHCLAARPITKDD